MLLVHSAKGKSSDDETGIARLLRLGIRPSQSLVSDREMKFTGERFVPGKPSLVHLYQEHMTRYMFSAQFVKNKRVLDLGCGCGYGSYYTARNRANIVVGIDKSTEAIEFSKRRYSANNLAFLLADVSSLPFSSAAFDVILAFELIEHVQDYKAMLTEVKRVLASSGVLVVSTPNKETYKTKNEFHIKEFTLSEFRRTLQNLFKHVKIVFQSYPSGLAIRSAAASNQPNYEIDEIETKTSTRPPAAVKDALYFVAVCSQRSLRNVKEFIYLFSNKSLLLQSWEEWNRWVPKLQKEFEERTQWALKLEQELKQRDATILKLQKEFEERTQDKRDEG